MNKNFETLEKVLLHMADNVYQPVEFPLYIGKLEKEFAELMAELTGPAFDQYLIDYPMLKETSQSRIPMHHNRVKDELADVLVFLIRISNKLDIPATQLIHHAISKMVKRLDDPNYNKS